MLLAEVDQERILGLGEDVDYSQGLPTLGADSMARPDEAIGYVITAALSGAIAGYMTYRQEGLRQAALVGSVVFFGITSVKMFVDIWRRP
jgi:hypothetical protein